MKVPILNLQWERRHLLITWLKEIKCKISQISDQSIDSCVLDIQKLDKFK